MPKYDNCKDCQNFKCEHCGKNREFICIGGVSCKIHEYVVTPIISNLERSFNRVDENAHQAIMLAIKDLGDYDDPTVALEMLFNAAHYLGKAAQTAAILSKEYNIKQHTEEVSNTRAYFDSAYEMVMNHIKGAIKGNA